jgi:hypothetical protein
VDIPDGDLSGVPHDFHDLGFERTEDLGETVLAAWCHASPWMAESESYAGA